MAVVLGYLIFHTDVIGIILIDVNMDWWLLHRNPEQLLITLRRITQRLSNVVVDSRSLITLVTVVHLILLHLHLDLLMYLLLHPHVGHHLLVLEVLLLTHLRTYEVTHLI